MSVDDGARYEHAPCGLLSTTDAGVILRANRTFCRWLGYEETELTCGMRFADLLTMGGKIFHQTHWVPLMRMQGSVAEVHLEMLHKDGRRLPALVNAASESGVHEIAAFAAVDRRRYEDELLVARRRAEELLKSERTAQGQLAEVTAQRAVFGETLVGIVSHDLRSPLSVVSMGAELLATSITQPEQRRLLDRIQSANARALRLVSDLLDFTQARLGGALSVAPREIDLNALAVTVVEDLRFAWPGRELAVAAGASGRTVIADPDRLGQAITNLVTNAITYGDPQRAICVSTSYDEDSAAIAVHNWGPPIPPGLVPHLFEPLRRGEQSMELGSRSVGLGLYIVSKIAAAHGGDVVVRSSLEEGTSFTMRLGLPPATVQLARVSPDDRP